jgi:hypothetical protein
MMNLTESAEGNKKEIICVGNELKTQNIAVGNNNA